MRSFAGPIIAVLLAFLAGCATQPLTCDRACVADRLRQRTGHEAASPANPSEAGTALADGLTEDAAIIFALWNNAAFQEVLADLQLSRADLIQARLLHNPELIFLAPAGAKPLEYAIEVPIEVLWLRPLRTASARLENERVCERLVQSGLDLIRDVRQAYADLVLAQARQGVAEEGVRLRRRIAELAEARLRAGDASPLETAAARTDALQAEQDLIRLRHDVTLAEERLRHLLGLGVHRGPLVLRPSAPVLPAEFDTEALAEEAVSTRPDALAADQAVGAAEQRVRLARLSWFHFFGILDVKDNDRAGPGFRVTLPIFNHGQDVVARAEAELERAVRQRETVHQQILLDVRRAATLYRQARTELDYLEQRVRPEVEAAVKRADRAYQEGDTTYLLVLEAARRLLDSQLRAAQLHADLRRAWAELERSVGRRLCRQDGG